jgi:hypothetical protein
MDFISARHATDTKQFIYRLRGETEHTSFIWSYLLRTAFIGLHFLDEFIHHSVTHQTSVETSRTPTRIIETTLMIEWKIWHQ